MTAVAADAAAQTYQGGVRGAVRDANGVVPGAEVVLINEQTTLPRTTVTNEVGEYAFVTNDLRLLVLSLPFPKVCG